MRDQELVNALRYLCPGNFTCARCEYEPVCHGDGCAIIQKAADRIEAQAKEIERLRAQVPRWIPVEERLPETQGWYHVAIRDEKTKRIAVELDLYAVETAKNFGHEIGFCKDGRWDGREKVIAWMPLPEPPEVEDT